MSSLLIRWSRTAAINTAVKRRQWSRTTNPGSDHPTEGASTPMLLALDQIQGLGYGYQTLIAWVVDFAARMFETYPDSEQPLSEPAVCLVDEIDLHLHPTWQRKVMRYLSELFPRTQFIVPAHSPLIVQAAPELGADVAVLRQEGDYVVILNDPIDVKGWRADQILASELFDEVPLRADPVQAKMNERTALLTKSVLTKKEKARLKVLDETSMRSPCAVL